MKTDRRVKYTKAMLRRALVELLSEKPIAKITIKELCERADVNRGTFYSHYTDQYDLISQTVCEIVAELSCYLDDFVPEDISKTELLTVQKLFEYIGQNAEIFKALFSENCGLDFQGIALRWMRERDMFRFVGQKLGSDAEMTYIYPFVVTGCIGVVREWLASPCPRSAQEIALLVTSLVGGGLSAFSDT